MKTCPNCNVTVTSEQRRCGNCGYALTPTHVSFKKTEPIISPPPTYIPPPSPHPVATSRWSIPRINLPPRTRLVIAGVLAIVLIAFIALMLMRPPALSAEWYGPLASTEHGSTLVYAEIYLNLQAGAGGMITGSGEYCALAHNPVLKPGQRSPFQVTGSLSGSHITLALDANRYGGTPGTTTYLGTLSGQRMNLQLQLNGATSSIGLALHAGARSAYQAVCVA